MFSGIVEALGTVSEIRAEPPGCRLIVREPKIAAETAVADSICVNGCCLTVVAVTGETFAFQAGPETLARTNLGDLKPGSPVNLERSLAVNARLGGHFVSGHIDGVGKLWERIDEGDWSTFWFSVPRALARQMASKGSIAVDGVSLTIVGSEPDRFSVALIPFTLAVTTLGTLAVGGKVNLETDILAKYVQRLVESQSWPGEAMTDSPEKQTLSFLLRRFQQAGIKPRTDLGQNFLIDMNLQRVLLDTAQLGPDDVVLEVGTGTGGLTLQMAPLAAAVVSVEVDRELYQLAGEELFQFPNVTLLHTDVLKPRAASSRPCWKRCNGIWMPVPSAVETCGQPAL